MNRFDHRRVLYPLALSAALGNWRILIFVFAVLVASDWGERVVEISWGLDIIQRLLAVGILLLVGFAAAIALDFAIVPTLLSEGTVRSWQALSRITAARAALHVVASLMIALTTLLPLGLVFLFGTGLVEYAAELEQLYLLWGYIAIALHVLTVALLGLIYPDIITHGRFAPARAFRWGRENFLRLIWLLGAALVPFLLLLSYLESGYQPSALGELEGEDGGPGLDEFLDACLFSAIELAMMVLTATALSKVYYVVAPAEELEDSTRVAELFD